MKKSKLLFIIGGVFLAIAVIFTTLLKFGIDEEYYHPNPLEKNGLIYESFCDGLGQVCDHIPDGWNEKVSFSTLNFAVDQAFLPSYILYKITDYLGLIPILCAGIYAIFGFIQLIKRKDLKKIDKGLFVLAGLFAISIATYFLFEKLAINYRPVRIDGELEASYPSSHTMLMICISFGIILLNRFAYKNVKLLKYLNPILVFLTAFIVAGRFFSGVHWATDIIGGLLFATSFVLIYSAVLEKIYLEQAKKVEQKHE